MIDENTIVSHVCIYNLASGEDTVIFSAPKIYEAPNWSRCGEFLVINHQGLLFKLNIASGELVNIPTGFATRCNNDHGISPDGTQLVISHKCEHHGNLSTIYKLPIEGGEPTLVTENSPSYWHGWSPDGKSLAYVARRHEQDLKIYAIDIDGQHERALTSGPGLDDGPEYSPCGNYIYYNSFASGRMQLWQMTADGKDHQQIVDSQHSDWFAHPAPNGEDCIFIRYLKDQGQAHPFGQDVQLMHLNLKTRETQPLTDVFYGGQGSLNVPSWSPDGKSFAYVRYEKVAS